jgi:cytoskeleton protein RodZ
MKAQEYVDIGHYLRDSRESLRITIDDAAYALHIRPKYLRALESGDLHELPGKAYTRGYIRNYVEFLGLNSAEVMGEYEALLAHKGHEFFVPEPTLKQNLPSGRVLKWSAVGIVLLYGYWYFAVHDSSKLPENTAEMPQEFVLMLEKSMREGMDKAWEVCIDSGDVACFIALRYQSTVPERATNVPVFTKPAP